MRPGARLLARVSAAANPEQPTLRPVAPWPASVAARVPDGRTIEVLKLAIDGQLHTVDALVTATQAQVRALIGLRTVAIGDGDATRELADIQAAVSNLSAQLGSDGDYVRDAALEVQREFGLGTAPMTLAALAAALPHPERRSLEERVSALRSLAQSLQELQRISQIHAHRGLHALSAWRSVLGAPNNEAGTTYSRTGRARVRPTQASSVDLDL